MWPYVERSLQNVKVSIGIVSWDRARPKEFYDYWVDVNPSPVDVSKGESVADDSEPKTYEDDFWNDFGGFL